MTKEPTTPQDIQPFVVQSWTQTIIRPSLIILMVTAFMGALISLANIISPHQAWFYSCLLCFGFILESYFTNHWLQQPARRNVHHLKYRAAEIIVMVLVVRFSIWASQNNWPTRRLWFDYIKDPFQLFNDTYFWVTLALCLIAWQRIIAISQAFLHMKPDKAEQAYYNSPRNERDLGRQPLSDDRSSLLHDFAQQFLGGGLVVLFCAGIASFDVAALANIENPTTSGLLRLGLSPGMLTSLLLYFLCGFLLLSQGRLAVLEIRWLADGVKMKTPIGRHWHRQTLFLLLAMGFIAAFLPIGSTLPFVRLLNLVIYIIITAFTSLVYLISLIVAWLLSFFLPNVSQPEALAAPPPAAPPTLPPPPAADNAWQYLFSSAFWAVAIVVSLLAFGFFLQDRGVKLNSTFFKRSWLTLKLWWQQLRQGMRDQFQDIQGGLQSLFQRDTSSVKAEKQSLWHFIRVNGLPPREKIYYFYLSTVRRAEQQGVPRQESETPLEFMDDLKTNWPDATQEIDELTEAFLQARYSPKPIEEDGIPPIQKQWKNLKSNLKKRKKGK